MNVTCAVLMVNEKNQMFLVHSTGNNFYDLPKGMRELNETSLQAAVRECKEETSIDLDGNNNFIDLGETFYNKKKNINVFKFFVKNNFIDVDKLVCTSMFEDFRTKKMLPEVDGFMWVEISEENIKKYLSKSMINILKNHFYC